MSITYSKKIIPDQKNADNAIYTSKELQKVFDIYNQQENNIGYVILEFESYGEIKGSFRRIKREAAIINKVYLHNNLICTDYTLIPGYDKQSIELDWDNLKDKFSIEYSIGSNNYPYKSKEPVVLCLTKINQTYLNFKNNY
jgi:hypothetical protein